jgi:DNA-binding NtrC family response regulator
MRILVVGKFESQVSKACQMMMDRGQNITNADNIDSAIEKIMSGDGIEVVFLNVEDDIKSLAKTLKSERISIPIIAYGINANSRLAAQAIKNGAEEYVPMPPDEDLIMAILEAISEDNSDVISSSPKMNEIIQLAEKIAPSDANVLVTGESGTGKEVISKYIHKNSTRSKEKFVSVNCAAIPDNLLESELFGHEKGAFTGALHKRIGKFEESNNGTLLLDEISEMDLRLQAKLLRAIQEKEITRVGGNNTVKLNLRVIATSNRNLQQEVKDGNFREDLLFRLNVIHIDLPPLRERKEDIKSFAELFARKYAESNSIDTPKISPEALERLEQHNWQGNVRELENTIHRAVLLSNDGLIDKTSLLLDFNKSSTQAVQSPNLDSNLSSSENIENSSSSVESNESNSDKSDAPDELEQFIGRTVSDVERELILKTLDHVSGNKSKAANILGISIRTLHNKLKEYG